MQLRGEDILLRGLKWSKLLDTEKKGQWWISGEVASGIDDVEDMPTTIIKEVVEAQKLVQLAAAQRMNTDIRRAIFCIIMSGEDYLDAFEKLLRLDLTGKQVCSIVMYFSLSFLRGGECSVSTSLNSCLLKYQSTGPGDYEGPC